MRHARHSLVVLSICSLIAGCEVSSDTTPEPEVPAGPPVVRGLSVEIRPVIHSQEGSTSLYAGIHFRNHGTEPVWILKPVDGSSDGRYMPHYLIKVGTPDGKPLTNQWHCAHCGLWKDTKWPKDYLVELKPGQDITVRQVIFNHQFQEGRHSFKFSYTYLPDQHDFAPPVQAWRGTVESPEVVVNWKPDPKRKLDEDHSPRVLEKD